MDKDKNESSNLINEIGVAVDVGTTTIGVSCIDIHTNTVINEFSFSNPQKVYGADVITRIKNCIDDPSAEKNMSDMLLIRMNEELKNRLGESYSRIIHICYSGNTTMLHILRCLSVEGLSKAPFSPVTLDYFECRVTHDSLSEIDDKHVKQGFENSDDDKDDNADNNTTYDVTEMFLPGFSSFVGADILAGAEYLGMGKNDEYDLLIDLGTNGEMLLINNKCGYATSTACGPVFDYGITGAVYGSESIHAIAGCVKRGLIDNTGLIKEPFFERGIELDKGFVIRQENVRRFQMAKAAIFAGIKCLMKKAGIDYVNIGHVYISGGLGFYLDVKDAFITQMLPTEFRGRITVSGNTSLEGAKRFLVSYGNDNNNEYGLDSEDKSTGRNKIITEYKCMINRTEAFELADYEEFQDVYIKALNF